jgi:hypothetical protein
MEWAEKVSAEAADSEASRPVNRIRAREERTSARRTGQKYPCLADPAIMPRFLQFASKDTGTSVGTRPA